MDAVSNTSAMNLTSMQVLEMFIFNCVIILEDAVGGVEYMCILAQAPSED